MKSNTRLLDITRTNNLKAELFGFGSLRSIPTKTEPMIIKRHDSFHTCYIFSGFVQFKFQ